MLGTKSRTFAQQPPISLDELVPHDHFYRRLHAALDLSFIRSLVLSRYAAAGRPSIDPIVFFKLQLVMFFEGIRSERQLLVHAADRLSVRWYLGYDLHEALPNHSSLTRIRDGYGVTVFRQFFDTIIDRCHAAGLLSGRSVFVDATKVQANADPDTLKPRWFVEQHLAHLFPEAPPPPPDPPEAAVFTAHLTPDQTAARVSENQARHDWIAQNGAQDRRVSGFYERISERRISTTDPDATLLPHQSRLGYHTHYLVDGGKARIILSALVTPAAVMENQPVLDLVWRSQFRWKLPLRQLTADAAYGTIAIIKALEDNHIRAYVPLSASRSVKGAFAKEAFRYDAEADVYWCPAGTALKRFDGAYGVQSIRYQAPRSVCKGCALRAQCTTQTRIGRTISRHVDEAYFDKVRTYHERPAYLRAMRKRAVWVEPLFGEAKQWHGLRRFRLRRLEKVNIEALLIATGQNIKRLIRQRSMGTGVPQALSWAKNAFSWHSFVSLRVDVLFSTGHTTIITAGSCVKIRSALHTTILKLSCPISTYGSYMPYFTFSTGWVV